MHGPENAPPRTQPQPTEAGEPEGPGSWNMESPASQLALKFMWLWLPVEASMFTGELRVLSFRVYRWIL